MLSYTALSHPKIRKAIRNAVFEAAIRPDLTSYVAKAQGGTLMRVRLARPLLEQWIIEAHRGNSCLNWPVYVAFGPDNYRWTLNLAKSLMAPAVSEKVW